MDPPPRLARLPSFSPPESVPPLRRSESPSALAALLSGEPGGAGSTTPRPSPCPFLRPTTSCGSGPSRSDASPAVPSKEEFRPPPLCESAPSPRSLRALEPTPLAHGFADAVTVSLHISAMSSSRKAAAASTPPDRMDRCCRAAFSDFLSSDTRKTTRHSAACLAAIFTASRTGWGGSSISLRHASSDVMPSSLAARTDRSPCCRRL
mmetsp:Transcript_7866/g.31148  ORF Transcript_7866/g.31148 Transcript_7866/m.31148 type:complete len:207 (-) Transcript_7866:1110-1730(-)